MHLEQLISTIFVNNNFQLFQKNERSLKAFVTNEYKSNKSAFLSLSSRAIVAIFNSLKSEIQNLQNLFLKSNKAGQKNKKCIIESSLFSLHRKQKLLQSNLWQIGSIKSDVLYTFASLN